VPFKDVLRALNPLQHVPVVGTIYRAVTGDTIPAPLRILGADGKDFPLPQGLTWVHLVDPDMPVSAG